MYIVIVRLMRVSKMPDDMEYLLSWYLIILRQYRVLPWTVPCNWPHQRYQAVKGQPMGTVKCCYNAVQIYQDITIGTAMTAAECKSDFIIITDSHTSPSRASYGVSMAKIWENKKYVIMPSYCIWFHREEALITMSSEKL